MMIGGGSATASKPIAALVGLAAVAASWAVIHTLYAVRYAPAYYSTNKAYAASGGSSPDSSPPIDFNEGPQYLPDYRDLPTWRSRSA